VKPRSRKKSRASASDEFLAFTNSVSADGGLWKYDIAGSIAHAHALAEAGVITDREKASMVSALKAIAKDFRDGKAVLDPALEDIHMNVEAMLTDRVGATGAKLHTGRSRNDQVALDVRLWTRSVLAYIMLEVVSLQRRLLERAKEDGDVIMPGYTHLQHAQPVLLSHHLLAHFWRLDRDFSRLVESYGRTNVCPLGAGALAGTSFGLDRTAAAEMLGMQGLTENSLDAVSDRDFAAEAAFALSLLMVHLSSLCEELVLWSSQEFGFLKLPSDMSSGSSMMPQKRNPDLPELVRGKTGRAVGDLVAILTLLKSLPLAYNRDLQEDKESLNDVFNTVGASLHALTVFLAGTGFDKVGMRRSAEVGLMTATDLADFLATLGVPFRTAHGLVKDVAEKSGGDQRKFAALADELIARRTGGSIEVPSFTLEESIARRSSHGGTSKKTVAAQIRRASAALSRNSSAVDGLIAQTMSVDRILA
jgi:argininosuccinate lyase